MLDVLWRTTECQKWACLERGMLLLLPVWPVVWGIELGRILLLPTWPHQRHQVPLPGAAFPLCLVWELDCQRLSHVTFQPSLHAGPPEGRLFSMSVPPSVVHCSCLFPGAGLLVEASWRFSVISWPSLSFRQAQCLGLGDESFSALSLPPMETDCCYLTSTHHLTSIHPVTSTLYDVRSSAQERLPPEVEVFVLNISPATRTLWLCCKWLPILLLQADRFDLCSSPEALDLCLSPMGQRVSCSSLSNVKLLLFRRERSRQEAGLCTPLQLLSTSLLPCSPFFSWALDRGS